MFCLLGLGQFGLTILVLFWIFVLLPIYFVPSYIAFKKQKLQKTAIVVLNVFLGWTFLGWVVALVWACMEDGISAADERQANLPETLTQKTIVTASISLFAVVIFIYLSWIFRGERWNQSEIDSEFDRYTRVIEFLPQCFQD
ncbi:MAG: superinfection immunity protein, partial [Pirellulales bacterium]